MPDDLNTPYSTPANAFQRQFVRTPYAVSFNASGKTFVLVTLHVVYGKTGADRVAELTAIAKWLRGWAESMDDYGQNLICMGDFNIDRKGDPLWQAFTSTGLVTAPGLEKVPRTLSSRIDEPDLKSFFDQIAWFERKSDGQPYLSLKFRQAGGINFQGAVLTELDRTRLSWRISDHYPLWVEFGLD